MRLFARVGLIVLILCSCSFAWSAKEHIQITRLAAGRLIADSATPTALKAWLQSQYTVPLTMEAEKDFFFNTHVGAVPKGYTGLSIWVVEPDLHANGDAKDSVVEPFGVHERLLHYLDLEILLTGNAKKAYRHDLSGKPRFEDIPNDMKDERYIQAGYLPLRIDQCYKQLIDSIKTGRINEKAGDQDNNAVRWTGYLAHYLADNTQPQHATIDYKSATYFNNKHKAPNVHAEVEYKMADDEKNPFMELRQEFWPLLEKQLTDFKDPVTETDPFKASVQVSLASYDALPLIGLAAMKASSQMGTPEAPKGDFQPLDTFVFFRFKGPYKGTSMTVMEMKAEQLAWAVCRVERTLKQAWEEAGK